MSTLAAGVDEIDQFRRLLDWHMRHEPVYMRGVSEAAVGRIRDFLAQAEYAEPTWFGPPPWGNGVARKSLRYLCALIPAQIPDEGIVGEVHALIANPGVSRIDVAVILGEHGQTRGKEIPGRVLRAIGVKLRQGLWAHTVAAETGVSRRHVMDVSAFLGSTEAAQDALWELALRFIDRGEDNAQTFSDETGVSLRRAKGLLRSVREGLEG